MILSLLRHRNQIRSLIVTEIYELVKQRIEVLPSHCTVVTAKGLF